jgi:hypothetical protein
VLRSVQAVLVLAGAGAAWYFVPDENLVPFAALCVALAVGGVLAIKACVRRLPAGSGDERRELLVEAGVVLAMVGLVGFLVLVVEYAD